MMMTITRTAAVHSTLANVASFGALYLFQRVSFVASSLSPPLPLNTRQLPNKRRSHGAKERKDSSTDWSWLSDSSSSSCASFKSTVQLRNSHDTARMCPREGGRRSSYYCCGSTSGPLSNHKNDDTEATWSSCDCELPIEGLLFGSNGLSERASINFICESISVR